MTDLHEHWPDDEVPMYPAGRDPEDSDLVTSLAGRDELFYRAPEYRTVRNVLAIANYVGFWSTIILLLVGALFGRFSDLVVVPVITTLSITHTAINRWYFRGRDV